ncbi:hypothetical protein KKF05_01715 [Patescibacteria group bacterium]|nr:hypothetical protein [Patescibacteria group bacterium]MBU1029593.1 hypothetical protein [Patescibacteria group bacterium]MBU1915589.1 hypothetical protein [Patescibacteria group bacterium]
MFSSGFQGGDLFGSPGTPPDHGFGDQSPMNGHFGQSPFENDFDFDGLNFLDIASRNEEVIDIGLHFHEKLRGLGK